MFPNKLLFFAVAAVSSTLVVGSKVELLKKCCTLGTNYANSGLKCTSFQPPIAGISKEDESVCLNSVDVCCKKQFREKQCQLGQTDAKSGNSCSNSGDDDGGSRKDCCEACQLGLETGATGQICESDIGLGAFMESAYAACCQFKQPTTSSTTTTTVATTSKTTTATTATTTAPASTTFARTTTAKTTDDDDVSTPLPASKITKSLEKFDSGNTPAEPSLEVLCDIPDLCAHICTPTAGSYKCECYEGFTLMSDSHSCRPSKRSSSNSRCSANNPCDHICTDTGVAIKCSCYEGFELASDRRTCRDVDECALGTHECEANEVCINVDGDYDCQASDDPTLLNVDLADDACPEGYKFDGSQMVCNDINECEIGLVCPKPGTCVNTVGSFKCIDESPKCPPGFYYKDSINACDDVDECLASIDDCNRDSQVCLNTKGNYTCIDKASKRSCPPGFKKNLYTQLCEDINECAENNEICAKDEECINEPGGHNCVKLSSKSTPPTTNSIFSSYPSSTYPSPSTPDQDNTIDIQGISPSSTASPVYPLYRSTPQTPQPVQSTPPQPARSIPVQPTQNQPSRPEAPPQPPYRNLPAYPPPSYSKPNNPVFPPFIPPKVSCSAGYKFSAQTNTCVDIDECVEDENICDSNQDCYNAIGSYICNCKNGFKRDYQTGACIDINECQVGQHDCSDGQRCDNTIGSFSCARTTGCGTGYTLNSATTLCEDDDECVLGTHNCHDLGPKFQCKNTLGSYRCQRIRCIGDCTFTVHSTTTQLQPVQPIQPTQSYPIVISQFKKCLPGYKMSSTGVCEDINECESNPCGRGEKCLNLNGRYQCIPYIQCKLGYELNEAGTGCVDVNECTRGTHKCKSSQICKNGPGYYICQCPPGHKLNSDNECEDINECEFYRERICSRNAQCVNTVGSYKCKCKEGFRENGQGCEDIDECEETAGLCHQNCVNLWGGYRCSCERGFTLGPDNRTCTDIDECEKFKDKNLCVGNCQNTPGSYACKCPDGYRLGADGRTCQDVDECQRSVCRNLDDVCVNTRGGFKCHTISCPPHYIKDPEHKTRCKRASNVCDIRDTNCIRMPGQYFFHFVTFVSNLPIPDEGKIDFFQMKGPAWDSSTANFDMNVNSVRCPRHVTQADSSFFRMKRDTNRVVLSLVKPIEGPQEVEIQLQMELYVSGVFQGKVVSTVYVFVSQYEF